MSTSRAALLGGAFGGASGGVVGGGITQLIAGPDANILLLWVAAFVGAIVSGVFSALVIRNDLRQVSIR
jgi:hypothetical protein